MKLETESRFVKEPGRDLGGVLAIGIALIGFFFAAFLLYAFNADLSPLASGSFNTEVPMIAE